MTKNQGSGMKDQVSNIKDQGSKLTPIEGVAENLFDNFSHFHPHHQALQPKALPSKKNHVQPMFVVTH